jgi:hypothetical protein
LDKVFHLIALEGTTEMVKKAGDEKGDFRVRLAVAVFEAKRARRPEIP